MRLCVGHSDAVDSDDAIDEVIDRLTSSLAGSSPLGALVYASPVYDHELIIATLAKRWPDCTIAGCTADGEFTSVAGFSGDSVAVGLIVADPSLVSCGAALIPGLAEAPEAVVRLAIKEAGEGLSGAATACFVFCDPFAVDLVSLCALLSAETPDGCLVVGGAAADHRIRMGQPSSPLQFGASGVASDAVSVLLVSGESLFSTGAACGWQPVGLPSVATKTHDNLVLEIDGKPATEHLKRWYPRTADTISAPGDRPVALCADGKAVSMRPLFAVDEQGGALVFGGSVPEGSELRICEALKSGLLSAASASAREALDSYPGVAPQGALVVNCAARKWTLGTETASEAAQIAGVLDGIPHLGFYSFGELIPNRDGASYFQSHTCATVVFGSV